MGPIHRTRKVYKSASISQNTISSMPEGVITHIMNRLPVQDAVRTGILSRNWRLKWTLLTKLVFDMEFFGYLQRLNRRKDFSSVSVNRLLFHLKGDITKFVLYLPWYFMFDLIDINHWIISLSGKGCKEFTLVNMHEKKFKLPTHLFTCLKLKYLELRNWCFNLPPSFGGFPCLLTLDFSNMESESCKIGELITRCPLLEILRIDYRSYMGKVKPDEIAKLENLKTLWLSLYKLDNMVITSSGIFQLLGHLPKLEELALDFQGCKFLSPGVLTPKTGFAVFLGLKSLTLSSLDFNSRSMVLCAIDLIHSPPNLQTLKITATDEKRVLQNPLSSCVIDNRLSGNLQLQTVELECIESSQMELCLIKSLLAYSSLLRTMVINNTSGKLGLECESCSNCSQTFCLAKKLLMFHRASPKAEINLNL